MDEINFVFVKTASADDELSEDVRQALLDAGFEIDEDARNGFIVEQ